MEDWFDQKSTGRIVNLNPRRVSNIVQGPQGTHHELLELAASFKSTSGKLVTKYLSIARRVRNSLRSADRPRFVSAFCQTNCGDVSPNILGAFCTDTGPSCDFNHSTCGGKNELCYARGPSVKRNVMALTEAMEREVDRREDAASKKTKASTKLQCSKKKKHRSEVLNGAEDEFVTDEIDKVNNGESLPTNVKGVEQASCTPDEAEKVHLEPEVSNAESREVSKDPSPVAANKEDNAWTVITTGGWNKWANNGFVVHGKGSALGPALKWLRSAKPDWLKEKT